MGDNSDYGRRQDETEPQAGERLAAARRARNVSISEIAKELRLDEPRVLALEENRFEVLGAPVFTKGYMRKYAALIGVPIEDVLNDYYRLHRTTGAPPVVGPKRKVQRDIAPGAWIAAALVIAIAAVVLWWWFGREQGNVVPAARPPAPATLAREAGLEAAADQGASGAEALPPPGDAAGPLPDAGDALRAPPPPGTVVAEVIAAADAAGIENPVELSLSYSGDCWTEVTDAAGRRLFFDLGVAGRSVTLRGSAPLEVLLGNSENVSLEVDGVPYVPAATGRRDNTARLTINSQ